MGHIRRAEVTIIASSKAEAFAIKTFADMELSLKLGGWLGRSYLGAEIKEDDGKPVVVVAYNQEREKIVKEWLSGHNYDNSLGRSA